MIVEIKPSNNEKGCFAKYLIQPDQPIIEITGPLLSSNDLNNEFKINYSIQINRDRFIGPSGKQDDYINHSCEPNCYIHIAGNRAFLYSMYVIKPGMECTIDYSITSSDTLDTWKMNCNCKSFKCRKIISGYSSLPDDIKTFYMSKKLVPKYIWKE